MAPPLERRGPPATLLPLLPLPLLPLPLLPLPLPLLLPLEKAPCTPGEDFESPGKTPPPCVLSASVGRWELSW